MTSQRRETVFHDSWRALIEDNSHLFIRSQDKESAASTNAPFYHLSIWEGLLVRNYSVTHQERCFVAALALMSAVWKMTTVRTSMILVISPFCPSWLFGGKSVLYYMNGLKVLLHSSLLGDRDGRLAEHKCTLIVTLWNKNHPPIPDGRGTLRFLLVPAPPLEICGGIMCSWIHKRGDPLCEKRWDLWLTAL